MVIRSVGMEQVTCDKRTRSSSHERSSNAPWYRVPKQSIVSVEHPFIIKDIDKGLATLGNPGKVEELVQEDGTTASLYLRQGDRMAKPLKSANVSTNNILLKVTVPKRTGLKRRRGAEGPYHEGAEVGVLGERAVPMVNDARYLFRSMSDNSKSYQVEAVGTINQTHRFRGMPDFVTSTVDMPLMQRFREHVLPFDYEKMKGFKIDMSKGVKPNTEIIPPPSWTHLTLPFNYSYRQNPSVKKVVDHLGNVSTVNVSAGPRIGNPPVPFDVDIVPQAPSPSLPAIETLTPSMQRLINTVLDLMKDRPIFTRRALYNCIPGNDWDVLGQNSAKHVYQYAGYMFSSGPWRDALVRYGVDPRTDPSFRKYQTMLFMLEVEPKDIRARSNRTKPDRTKTEQVLRKETHLFDGTTVSKDGKIWQVCDISEPFLKALLSTTNLRKDCHSERDGWYHNGTWAKVKIIMKAKIAAILDGVPPNDAAFAKVVEEMPEIMRNNNRVAMYLSPDATPEEIHLASVIRTTAQMYYSADQDGTRGNDGYGDEGDQDGEMVVPMVPENSLIDPRITDAVLQFDSLE
ncbi:MAG: tau 95 subunit of transcription factor TFIIIC [Alectoria sarmentosa]|nr:MAG: tau 95 subunit of transcription factor TFIIIC [Alectoria sarmentosa]CAD6590621.1 MAG: tau 95 subunit of transcription factor TFIIIC [Alectoria sarmentosa]